MTPLVLLLRAGFWIALVAIVVLALMPQPPIAISASDKLQHMAAFALLTALAGLGYPEVSLPRIVLRMAVIGAGIEIAQLYPALGRSGDVTDFLADMAASVAVAVLLVPVRRWAAAE